MLSERRRARIVRFVAEALPGHDIRGGEGAAPWSDFHVRLFVDGRPAYAVRSGPGVGSGRTDEQVAQQIASVFKRRIDRGGLCPPPYDPRCRCDQRIDLEWPIASADCAPLWVIGYMRGCPVEGHRPDRLLIYGVPVPSRDPDDLLAGWPAVQPPLDLV